MNKFLRYSFIGLLAVLFANVSAQDINTCADVIAGEDGVTFRIKGECTEIKNTTFGNWMLKDATGEVYIYGTLDAEGKTKNFGSLGIEVGDIVTVEGPKKTYNTTVELVNVTVIAIEKGSSPDNPDPQPSGEVRKVTIADFNAAEESTEVWYQLTGVVKNLKDGDKYGNFDLEDETGSVYVYGLLSEKDGAKQKFQELVAEKGIKEGCKLTIIGNRGSYKDKIEVVNAYFVSIEGGSVAPDPQPSGEAKGTGTQDDPFNAVAATNFVASLEADQATEQDYYVKGKIVGITDSNQFSSQYGNCTFSISDDGSDNNAFLIYRTLYLGNVKYTEGVLPQAGDEVVICGKLVNYKGNTPETVQNQSYIYSLNGQTSGIQDVKAEEADAPIYNMAGQRVEHPAKGIYIKNGRKYIVK